MRRPSDHFSAVADTYAAYRPHYPDALFAWLAEVAPGHTLVWEPGAGSGQATPGLAAWFDHVVATDLSDEMIERAPANPRVAYVVGLAEASGLPDHSVDLVAVAQALHWFDFGRFFAEAQRVLVPGGVIAAWSYGVLHLQGPEVNRVFQDFYRMTIAPYWPPERRHVENGYRSIPWPFAELETPPFQMTARWPLEALLGYCRSWSAVARYRREHGEDPVMRLGESLAEVWGDSGSLRTISWPLTVRAGRVHAADTTAE